MAGFGLDHLLDPLVGGDFLTSMLSLLMERREQQQTRSDPNILGYINNLIGEYNASNAYNPETGQFNAGSPFGDASSGHGGAYGQDRNGNPLSPFQFNTQYGLSQLAGAQGGLDAGLGNLARVAEQAGVAAPSGFSLNVPSGIDPGAVQGVDQGVRVPPTPLSPLAPAGGLLSGNNGGLLGLGLGQGGGRGALRDFVGSFAVGTTSVPRTGLAQVHQGEAIVPAGMNPLAGAPSRPMVPAAPAIGNPQAGRPMVGAPVMSGPAPSTAPQTGMSAPLGASRPMVGPPVMSGPAPATAGGLTPPAPPVAAPPAMGGGYGALTPGLSPEVQAQLVNRGRERIGNEFAGVQRDLRNSAPAGGGGGALERRMFDAEVARAGQVAGLQRDVGLEAANRQFTDQLAANNFALQRDLGFGGLGVQQGQLALQGELGRGDLGVRQGQLANDTFLAQLQQEIQRGQLGQGQQQIDLSRILGMGELGQGQQAIDLQGEIQRGQLGQGQQGLDLQRLLQNMNYDLGVRGLDVEDRYNQGQLGLGRGELDFRNRSFDADFSRGLASDAFGQYQYGQSRNDALAQQDFQNQLQQWGLQNNQNQFGQLLGLLGQFPGQAGGGQAAPPQGGGGGGFRPLGGFFQDMLQGGGGGGGGQGFQPFGGFFQNLFGRN